MTDDDTLAHYGVLHKSGRYPWGSGENPYQRSQGFVAYVEDMRRQGLSDTEIARGIGMYNEDGKPMSTTEFRATNTIAKNQIKQAEIARALELQSRGMSNVAIGKAMGKNESSVRALLQESTQKKVDTLEATAQILRDSVQSKKYLDVGVGTNHHMGVSQNTLQVAIAMLREEGYNLYYLKVPQLGTTHETTLKVLVPEGVTYSEFQKNRDKVQTMTNYSEDGGLTYKGLEPPRQVKSNRIIVRTGEQGGNKLDGVIELRRGVDDISMGSARYAQVRIAVDGTHYLKGMAIYADDLPDGVDIRFNTNKTTDDLKKLVMEGEGKNLVLASMKPQKTKQDGTSDKNNPFGSMVRQKHYLDANGKEQLSALNIVNEEGVWNEWSSKLSSQFLSKQSPALAKEQLGVRYDSFKSELEDISKLTNPAVKRKLLETFADNADSSSVHLKAAGLPRTKTHVILPINSLKDGEIYAPKYNNGEKVVLIRHPHGGIFEIPELTVNNRNQEAKRLIPNAADAVGINSKVAQRLSGADFDGDTVLVIPNDARKVKTSPALLALKDFDPQTAYPKYDGMKVMTPQDKQHKMGDISNLITDMTIRGATQAELARAVKHSMVVIDAEKHKLNYKQSYIDNNIAELKIKYQETARSGASTLISRTTSRVDVPKMKPRPAELGGPIDKVTGEKKFIPKGSYKDKVTGEWILADETYVIPAHTRVTKGGKEVEVPEQIKVKKDRSTKGAETRDARTLIDPKQGTPIEYVYADYSNKLKTLADKARKEMVNTQPMKVQPSAKEVYKNEVNSLKAKLNLALKNAPLERQAQVIANALVKQALMDRPDMERADLKKIQGRALEAARDRVGAKKTQIVFEGREWEAIQSGAVSTNVLESILNNTDLDRVKELATPRQSLGVTSAKLSRARSMLASGYTQAEVAAAIGVSVSTLSRALNN